MIFFTVGTEQFPFDSLIQIADEVFQKLGGETVFVQTGYCKTVPTHSESKAFLSYEEFSDKMTTARVVVSHGGVGSLILCLRHGKIPIVLPRRKHLHEHVDDHQVELTAKMEKLGCILLAQKPEDIFPLIQNYEKQKLTRSAAFSLPRRLSQALRECLKSPLVK